MQDEQALLDTEGTVEERAFAKHQCGLKLAWNRNTPHLWRELMNEA